MIPAADGYATVDELVAETLFHVSPWQRFLAGFRRRRGPLVRYWSAGFDYLGADPIKVETWPAWAQRQTRRPLAALLKARWFAR